MDKILIVDDEHNVHYSFRRVLGNEYEILSAFSGDEALRQIEDDSLRLVLMDVRMPGVGGLDALQELKQRRPDLPVIMMTAFVSAETAIRATTLDAEDYLVKPFDVDALKRLIAITLQRHESAPTETDQPQQRFDIGAMPILGHSRAMQDVYKVIGKSASRDVTVLLTGESGTGKELVARALHAYSQRGKGPFLAINCAAIPESLLESELFGHERGAFSGATEARPGKFELAHGGTLFLDEIGDMPLILQAKLLRVLQEREICRLGARESRLVDVRIIAATNQDPEGLIRANRFREDLYYRLNVVRITLPPLRDRGEDILLLAEHFLHLSRRDDIRSPQGFSPDAREKLLTHSWPGNVRELANVVAQAAINTRGRLISAEDLALSEVPIRSSESEPAPVSSQGTTIEDIFEKQAGQVFTAIERIVVAKALKLSHHNQVQAARLLGISRNVLRDRMKRYGLS
jgi:two-component system nitrogen regulation response regulator GlnG